MNLDKGDCRWTNVKWQVKSSAVLDGRQNQIFGTQVPSGFIHPLIRSHGIYVTAGWEGQVGREAGQCLPIGSDKKLTRAAESCRGIAEWMQFKGERLAYLRGLWARAHLGLTE